MNRLNAVVVVITLAILIALANAQQAGKSPTSTLTASGRFQLLAGEFDATTNNRTQLKGIFRIDTATGQTSVYRCCTKVGDVYEDYWHRIPDEVFPK